MICYWQAQAEAVRNAGTFVVGRNARVCPTSLLRDFVCMHYLLSILHMQVVDISEAQLGRAGAIFQVAEDDQGHRASASAKVTQPAAPVLLGGGIPKGGRKGGFKRPRTVAPLRVSSKTQTAVMLQTNMTGGVQPSLEPRAPTRANQNSRHLYERRTSFGEQMCLRLHSNYLNHVRFW